MDAATVAGRRSAFPIPATHVRILIVCAVRLLRDGLAEVLDAESDLAVVGHACGGDDAMAHLHREPPPDVVLIDAGLPHALGLVRGIRQVDPRVRCVPFGIDDGPEPIAPWMQAGAAVAIRRSAGLAELVDVLRSITRAAGARPPEPRPVANEQQCLPESPLLTRRERQILEQIYVGRSNKEIARVLGIEPATVKCHVHNLLAKLNLQRRAQAAVWLREHDASTRETPRQTRSAVNSSSRW